MQKREEKYAFYRIYDPILEDTTFSIFYIGCVTV